MRLYDLNSCIKSVVDQIEHYAQENDGLIPENLDEQLSLLDLERNEKIHNIALWIKNLRVDSAAIKTEEKQLSERRKAIDNKIARLEAYLEKNMHANEKLEFPNAVISFRQSEACIVDNMSDVPAEFTKVEVSPKLTDIKAAIKAGTNISYAHIEERINISVK